MESWYDEGMGAAINGCDWVETVMGRFLSAGERRLLASGWFAGQQYIDEMEAEQRRREEFEASVELERVGVAGDDQIPW